MKNYLYIFFAALFITSCKSKKDDSESKSPEVRELYNAYSKLKLPFYVVDSTMNEKAKDTTISLAAFTKVIPDTVFNSTFGTDRKFTLYPLGRIEPKSKESYFVTLAKGKDKSAIYISVYDSNKHTVTLPLLVSDKDEILNTASVDKKLSIVVSKEWTDKNVLYYNRIIYAYNNVGIFTTVLTETNEPRRTREAAIINPLDTFPKKYKYSGDYSKGSKSVLFIRDSNVPDEYLFFLHFQNENQDDACAGEVRNKFKMKSDKAGQYNGNSDPCVLDFTFKGNEVQVKENGSCGNYRDIKCFFNDTYTKKKEAKIAERKK
jgi:hypothetical protein